MTAPIIDRFYVRGEGHIPLSNFWIGDTIISPPYLADDIDPTDMDWATSEHFYQAAKFSALNDIEYVASASTPAESKRRGREHLKSFRPDWEAHMIPAMRQILSLKFAPHRPEADYLLGTGTALLIEGNDWNDRMWGAERDSFGNYTLGHNWLGWLLMAQRSYLRSLLVLPSQTHLEFD